MRASMLELHGRRALARLGARIASVYLIGAAAGVAVGPAAGPETGSATIGGPWAGVPAALGVLGLGLVIALAINCTVALVPPPPELGDSTRGDHDAASLVMPAASVPVSTRYGRWAAWVWRQAPDSARPMLVSLALRWGVVLAGLGVLAQVVATGPVMSWAAVHAVVGWVIPASGWPGSRRGPGWGDWFRRSRVGFALMVPAEAVAAAGHPRRRFGERCRRGRHPPHRAAWIRDDGGHDPGGAVSRRPHVHAEQRLAARRRLDA
jgi:hypothetical protein